MVILVESYILCLVLILQVEFAMEILARLVNKQVLYDVK